MSQDNGERWTEDRIRGVLGNPMYVRDGIVDRDTWIEVQKQALEEDGPEEYFSRSLDIVIPLLVTHVETSCYRITIELTSDDEESVSQLADKMSDMVNEDDFQLVSVEQIGFSWEIARIEGEAGEEAVS